MLILQLIYQSITISMSISWFAGFIDLNLFVGATPQVGQANNIIHSCKLVGECFAVEYIGLTLL